MRSMILLAMPMLCLSAGIMLPGNMSKNVLKKAFMESRESVKTDTVDFDQEKALSDLWSQIKGRESETAGEVFENIKIFEQLPAGRLLNVMEEGFSRSLGVTCTHCHNPKNWSSDEIPQKQIAREMMGIVGTINSELLANIQNLESDRPTVNCTTCHRGQVKPALNLDN